jgi:hypothetical protein
MPSATDAIEWRSASPSGVSVQSIPAPYRNGAVGVIDDLLAHNRAFAAHYDLGHLDVGSVRAKSVDATRRRCPSSASTSLVRTPRVSSDPLFGRAGSRSTTRNASHGGLASLSARTAAISLTTETDSRDRRSAAQIEVLADRSRGGEVASGAGVVDPLRDGTDDLHLEISDR